VIKKKKKKKKTVKMTGKKGGYTIIGKRENKKAKNIQKTYKEINTCLRDA